MAASALAVTVKSQPERVKVILALSLPIGSLQVMESSPKGEYTAASKVTVLPLAVSRLSAAVYVISDSSTTAK